MTVTAALHLDVSAAPDDDTLHPAVIVHRDAQGAVCYWAGYTNGHDSQGWTAERGEAREFETFSAANLERKRARRWHPTMQIALERAP